MSSAVEVALSLVKNGVVADISVSHWAGHLDRATEFAEFRLPFYCHVRCLPRKVVSEGRKLSKVVMGHLYDFTHPIGHMRFMPFKAYGEWKMRHDAAAARYIEHRDRVVSCWESFRNAIEGINSTAIMSSWRSINPSDTGTPPPSFTADFVRKAQALYPSKDAVYRQYKIELWLYPHMSVWCNLIKDIPSKMFEDYGSMTDATAWEFIEMAVTSQHAKTVSKLDCIDKASQDPSRQVFLMHMLEAKDVAFKAMTMDVSNNPEINSSLASLLQASSVDARLAQEDAFYKAVRSSRDCLSRYLSAKEFVAGYNAFGGQHV